MSEFYQWVIFLGFLAIIIIVIYLFAGGYIHTQRTQKESFKEWQKYNGGVVRMMCILLLLVCIGIGVYKYYQVNDSITAPPSLEFD